MISLGVTATNSGYNYIYGVYSENIIEQLDSVSVDQLHVESFIEQLDSVSVDSVFSEVFYVYA